MSWSGGWNQFKINYIERGVGAWCGLRPCCGNGRVWVWSCTLPCFPTNPSPDPEPLFPLENSISQLHLLQEDAGRLQVAMLHQDYSLQAAQSSVSKWESLLSNHKFCYSCPANIPTSSFTWLPENLQVPWCNMPQKCLFQGFPPSQALSQALFSFFFPPKGMLTHSRENIWRLILAWEQSEGKMGRGSPQLEGLKILAIKKTKKQKTKNSWIYGYPAALIAIVGWLDFTKNKASNVVFHPAEKPGSHFMPSSWEPHSQRGWQRVRGSLWEGPDSVGCWWLEENLMLWTSLIKTNPLNNISWELHPKTETMLNWVIYYS